MNVSACALTVSLISALLFALSAPLAARDISVGVKGGLSVPNLTAGGSGTPLSSGYSSRKGADFGIFAQNDFTKTFGVSVGLEYCAEGGKKEGFQAMSVPAEYKAYLPADTKYLYADYKSEVKLDYLLFPVLARAGWNPVSESSFRIYAALGPFFGLLVKAEQITSGSGMIYMDKERTTPITAQPVSFNKTTDIKSELRRYNIGVIGLAGVSYVIGQFSVFIEGGGNFGFIHIQKDASNGTNYIGAAVISTGVAYKI
jgi:hypothetical protein